MLLVAAAVEEEDLADELVDEMMDELDELAEEAIWYTFRRLPAPQANFVSTRYIFRGRTGLLCHTSAVQSILQSNAGAGTDPLCKVFPQ